MVRAPAIEKLTLSVFALFMSAYYVSYFGSFSPVYIAYISMIVVSFFLSPSLYMPLGKIYKDVLWAFILVCYFTVIAVCFYFNSKVLSPNILNLIFGLLAYIYIRQTCTFYSPMYYKRIYIRAVVVTLILLSIDSCYRLLHPEMNVLSTHSLWIYAYKRSQMFEDSNTTAIVAVMVLFSLVSINSWLPLKKRQKVVLYVWSLIIIMSCFSRSAYIATVVTFLYLKLNKIKYDQYLKYFVVIVLGVMAYFVVMHYFGHDGSFGTKFVIIDDAVKLVHHSNAMNVVFGYFAPPEIVLGGTYSHLFMITGYILGGLMGMILIIWFFIKYIQIFGVGVLLPFIIMGFSYVYGIGTPFVYVPLAICANITQLCKQKAFIKICEHKK